MAYFDHFAFGKPTWVGEALEKITMDRYFQEIDLQLNQETHREILEIGPGRGQLARIFIQRGYSHYDIVEPNDIMRCDLMKAGVRVCKSYLIPELEEEDESYDGIIVMDVFEHLNDSKEALRFIAEVYRVLRPGGLIFLISPDYNDWQKDFHNCDFSHNNITTVRRAGQLFQNGGLKTKYYQYHYSFLGGPVGYIGSRIVKALTAFQRGNEPESKLYKLRLTFLRRFYIAAQKMPA